jgi:DNA-binding protein HU-beta
MNNNSKLTDAVAANMGISKKDAEKAIVGVLSTVKELTMREGKVTLQGYGTFSKKVRAARTGRNPQTGGIIQIAEKEVFDFKASK